MNNGNQIEHLFTSINLPCWQIGVQSTYNKIKTSPSLQQPAGDGMGRIQRQDQSKNRWGFFGRSFFVWGDIGWVEVFDAQKCTNRISGEPY